LDSIELEMGTPQGSPISPVLAIIYASPILHLAKKWDNTTLSMYMDDGVIFAHAMSYHILT
jgi:retron-type reverse transcriptase